MGITVRKSLDAEHPGGPLVTMGEFQKFDDGLVRVTGRLDQSMLSFDKKIQ